MYSAALYYYTGLSPWTIQHKATQNGPPHETQIAKNGAYSRLEMNETGMTTSAAIRIIAANTMAKNG